MNNKTTFITISALLLLAIAAIFFWIGPKKQPAQSEVVISSTDEAQFVADVTQLDSLYAKLQKAVYEKDVSTTAEINIKWEKKRNAFLTQYANHEVLSKLANKVINNYRQRVRVIKETYRTKTQSLSEIEQWKEAVKIEEAKKEELKTENQMIKQALLTL